MSFEYEAYHIAGILKVWADILSRWIEAPDELKAIRRLSRNPTFVSDQYSHIDPLRSGIMPLPTYEVIGEMQKTYYPGGVAGLKFFKLKQVWEKAGLI